MKKRIINNLFAIFIIFMLIMNVFSNTLIVLATSDIASGQYGNITWNVDSAGKLTVSGTGNYSSPYTKGAPWYQYRSQITSAEINVTTGATDLSYMFYGCTNMVQVTFLSSFDTSLVTNMQGMFYGCNSLSNINLSNFNTANVNDMSYMFAGDNILSSLTITNFNTSKVTNMSNMFDGCEKVPSLNLSNFNTANVTSMRGMFNDCGNMTSLNISSFNTAIVTDMSYMFEGCSKLTNLDLSKFDTSKVTNMYAMFSGNNSLTALNISSFNTAIVTDMSYMFEGCSSITNLDTSKFDTAKVTSMYAMFSGCSNITELKISSFNTAKVADLRYFAYNCTSLTSINMSGFDLSLVTKSDNLLSSDINLTLINAPKNLKVNSILPVITGKNWINQSVTTETYTNLPLSKTNSITLVLDSKSYSVTLNTNGGTINSGNVTTYKYGVGATLPTDVTKTGCTFGGWYDNSSFTGNAITNITTTDDGNKTYYAKLDVSNYTITYDLDGGVDGGNPSSYTVATTTFSLKAPTKDGYIFTGWTGSNGTTANKSVSIAQGTTGSLSYKANWDAISYKITLNINGGTINSGSVTTYKYGVGAILPTDVTKTGYIFGGWYDNSSFTGNAITNITVTDKGDKTYYAKWDTINYTITYDLDGGTAGGNPNSYTAETTTFTLQAPTKDGYLFTGWTGSNGTTPNKNVTIAKGSTGNLSYKANWDAISYNVTFYTNGGTINSGNIATYLYGVGATLPTDVTKTGYTFVGWYDNSSFTGNTVNNISTTDIGNKAYYAKWSNTAYTITYNTNNGSINGTYPTTYSFGNGATLPTDITKEGYIFAGWYENSSFTGNAVDKILNTDNGNKTYYAKWNLVEYKITYNLDGGTETINPISYNKESSDIPLNNPTKAGYIFTGWTGSNGTAINKSVTIAKGTTGDLGYTANWNPITYTVKFDSNSGTGTMSDETYTYNVEQKLTANTFTRTGWDFGGWSTTVSGTPIYADQESVKNLSNVDGSTVTLYATWKIPPVFYITYNLDGGVNNDNPVSYNQFDLPLTLQAPTKEGYIFTGWTGSNGTTEETNVVIPAGTEGPLEYTAHWRAINYTFKYNANGGTGTISDTYCTFDIQGNLAENQFVKTGFKFIGWSTSPANSIVKYTDQQSVLNETKTDGDVINLYAVWEETSYKLSFIWSDGLDQTSPVAYHTTYDTKQLPITLDNPTRTGFTFLGWVINLGDTPQKDYAIPTGTTGDLTYIAIWKPDTFNISYDLQGGNGTFDNQVKTYSQSLNLYNTEPIKDGYVFLGWGTSGEANTVVYKAGDSFNQDQDTILYAVWKEDNVNVTFIDRGSVVKVVNIEKGVNVTPPDIEKIGYSLSWDKDLNNIQGDTIITAVWMPITYLVRYNSNNGTGNMTDTQFVYGEVQKLRKNTFTKEGCTFLGWSKSATDNTVIYQDEEALQNETSTNGDIINLYAVWYDNLYLTSDKYYIGDINPTVYESGDTYISRIKPDTKLSDFKNNIQTNGNAVLYNNGNSIDDSALVGTGMVLKITKGTETISIILIVTADLDGNGKCTITDLSIMNQHLTGKIILIDARLKAADLDYNGKISITDLSRLNQILTEKITLTSL